MTSSSQIYMIKLTGLQLFGYHGVLPHEKQYGQEFLIDCEVEVQRGLGDAGGGEVANPDHIANTVSYADLADLIEVTFKGDRFDLIESVADAILAAVLSHHSSIKLAIITVHKPSAPLTQKFADVSVTVVGSRDD